MRWPLRLPGAIVAIAAASLVPTRPVAGQEAASLDAVDSLVALGRADEARTALMAWLASRGPSATRAELQRSLWLRGILTVDPRQAAVDFQRLAVEFPGGEWTDDALLRLARYAEARGDVGEAARHYRAVLRDHPRGPSRAAAREWLAENDGAGIRAAEASTSPSEAEVVPAAEDGAEWGVQLGAFATLERARDLMERARVAGFEPRLVAVPDSDLLRVRIGRSRDAAAARDLADRAAQRGFTVYLVQDVSEETPVT